MALKIRPENERDPEAVYVVNETAFGTSDEAGLEEVFMVIELEPGALSGVSGRAEYHEAFNSLG